jgi:ABC-type uncharacterized transport system YnjBCD ATPase subunit
MGPSGSGKSTALALGKNAPNAEFLAICKCVLEAILAYDAALANFFCFTG